MHALRAEEEVLLRLPQLAYVHTAASEHRWRKERGRKLEGSGCPREADVQRHLEGRDAQSRALTVSCGPKEPVEVVSSTACTPPAILEGDARDSLVPAASLFCSFSSFSLSSPSSAFCVPSCIHTLSPSLAANEPSCVIRTPNTKTLMRTHPSPSTDASSVTKTTPAGTGGPSSGVRTDPLP